MQATIVEPKWRRHVGRIVVPMRVENLGDLELVVRGNLTADQVRSLEVEALVDTGAKYVGRPASLIKQLAFITPTQSTHVQPQASSNSGSTPQFRCTSTIASRSATSLNFPKAPPRGSWAKSRWS